MKVSLIATVKDAGPQIQGFLSSLRAQTRTPDEIVIVDGGSTDGTLGALKAAGGVTVIEAPGANIARGRNLAVAAATGEIIAVTDADCILDPRWLETILVPIDAGADVSMGAYRPLGDSLLQRAMAATNLPDIAELDAGRFMPSARSLAMKREAITDVGGWPEWLDVGEDMWVDIRWRRSGLDMRLARDAIVSWPMRTTLCETWTQYFRYARGDALAGMHPRRHALRFAVYAALAGGLLAGTVPALIVLAIGAAAYAAAPIARALRRGGPRRVLVAALTPFLLLLTDLAKMVGYLAGRAARLRRDPRPTSARRPIA